MFVIQFLLKVFRTTYKRNHFSLGGLLTRTLVLVGALGILSGCSLQAQIIDLSSKTNQGENEETEEGLSQKLNYSFDGSITGQVSVGDTLFVAGDFGQIGKAYSGLFTVQGNSFDKPSDLSVDGPILTSTKDSSGRIYILGHFKKINNTDRPHLARLNPDGTFDHTFPDIQIGGFADWDINNGSTTSYSLAEAGGKLYVRGPFTSIQGQARDGLAKINLVNNTVEAWDPGIAYHNDLRRIDNDHIMLFASGVVYIYSVVDDSFETLSDKLQLLGDNIGVVYAFVDAEYEVYIVEGKFSDGSPSYAVYRLYIYNRGEASPAYVKRVGSGTGQSRYSFERVGQKLYIAGLAYLADPIVWMGWQDPSPVECDGSTCVDFDGFGAINLDTFEHDPSFVSVEGNPNDIYFYEFNIFSDAENIFVCSETWDRSLRAFRISDNSEISLNIPFHEKGYMKEYCAGGETLADGSLLMLTPDPLFYDNNNIGSLISINSKTGEVLDLGFDGKIWALEKVNSDLVLVGEDLTKGLHQNLASPVQYSLIAVDVSDFESQSISNKQLKNLRSIEELFGPFNSIKGSTTKLGLGMTGSPSGGGILFYDINAGTYTNTDRIFVSDAPIYDYMFSGSKLLVVGELGNGMISNMAMDGSLTLLRPITDKLFILDMADEYNLINSYSSANIELSPYLTALGYKFKLNKFHNGIYLSGVTSVNGEATSVVKLNLSDLSINTVFKAPLVSVLYEGVIEFESLVSSLVQDSQGNLHLIGFFDKVDSVPTETPLLQIDSMNGSYQSSIYQEDVVTLKENKNAQEMNFYSGYKVLMTLTDDRSTTSLVLF